jgi:hypothetical protein
MAVDRVDLDEAERRIVVVATFVNESDQRLQIHVLDTGLRLSGRSITAGSERYSEQILEPGESVRLQTSQRVQPQEMRDVSEVVAAGEGVWNVSGRVQVSVDHLSEPLWLPFRYDVEVDR